MPEPQPRESTQVDEYVPGKPERVHPDDPLINGLRWREERDHWIRLFNRLEGAVSHWRKALMEEAEACCLFPFDDALMAAHDRVLKEATKGA